MAQNNPIDRRDKAAPNADHALRVPADQVGGKASAEGSAPPSTGSRASARSVAAPWVAVHHRADDRAPVSYGIRQAGFTTFWPREIYRIAKRDDVLRPYFPGYMFAQPAGGHISALIDVDNVICIVGMREMGRPVLVPGPLMQALLFEAGGLDTQIINRTPLGRPVMRPGQTVRITDSAYSGFAAMFQATTGADRVKVLVQSFGRTTAGEIKCASVAPA